MVEGHEGGTAQILAAVKAKILEVENQYFPEKNLLSQPKTGANIPEYI